MICFECTYYDAHNSCCSLDDIQTEDVTMDPKTLKIISCLKFIKATFLKRRIEMVKAQQTLSPGGSDELDPIIKEIQQGKYAELSIHLKTKDGIEFNFNYPG